MDILHPRGGDLSPNVLTADLVAQIDVTRHFFVDADIPVGLVLKRDAAAVWGNPLIGAHYANNINRRISGYAGVAVGIPIAGASKPALAYELGAEVSLTRAWRDPYRFFPRSLPLVARGGFEVDLSPAFLRVDLSPGLLVDTSQGYAAGYLDATATAGLRARFGLEGGVRGGGLFIFAMTDDHVQTSIEPFVGYATPERVGFHARYGVLVALDAPLGFGGVGVITHRFSFGAKF